MNINSEKEPWFKLCGDVFQQTKICTTEEFISKRSGDFKHNFPYKAFSIMDFKVADNSFIDEL